MPGKRRHLDEVVISQPWVLQRHYMSDVPLFEVYDRFATRFWTDDKLRDDADDGRYLVAVWRDDPSPIVLMTGHAFTDSAIQLGQNEELLHILVNGMGLGIAVQRPGVLPPARR